jgi:signal transduction histidine kinase
VSEAGRTRNFFGLSWRPRDSLATDKPWHDWAFWALQGAVIALYGARFGIEEAIGHGSVSNGADFTTLAVFVWPVLYAAVTFGPTAGTFTTALVAALSVPRLISFAQGLKTASLLSESIQVLILSVIGLVVGRRVAAERVARLQADDSRRAHLAAEARYRGLFRTNSAPILLIDASGKVVEANSAASSIFGDTNPAQDASTQMDLVDLVGAETARRLLDMPRRMAGSVMTDATSDPASDEDSERRPEGGNPDNPEGPDIADAVVVRVDLNGAPLLYRADATRLEDASGHALVQLVLHDVTIETLRQQWMEAYAARVLFAQEEERRHIAQELHDGPLQALVHLCRQIDAVGQGDGAKLTGELEDLRHLAESLVAELRGISRGLRPSVLDDLGLVAATRRLLEDLERRTGIDTSLGVSGTERRLPIPVELALFRVAQEAITNAEHHADPGRVAVGMSFEPGGVRLLVSDDGEGFESPNGQRGSLGLVGMRERLHIVGGRVEVHSQPGSGTTVDAWASTRVSD